MPKDKTASHLKICQAMQEEFTEKGFMGATIRGIGMRAGMTSASLYRHYASKEEMFCALVEPLITLLEEWAKQHREKKYELLQANACRDTIFGESVADMVRELILPNKSVFLLLMNSAQGTRYEHFLHDFAEENQIALAETIHFMKEQGYPAKELEKEELHMLMSAYLTAVFEPVIHGYPDDKINEYLKRVNAFFLPGWMDIMGVS